MINDFLKTEIKKKIKNGQFSFFDILQLPHTVISNSEKFTHPTVQCSSVYVHGRQLFRVSRTSKKVVFIVKKGIL